QAQAAQQAAGAREGQGPARGAAAQPLTGSRLRLRAGHVDVARPERLALRGEARPVEAHERERLAALALRRRVAAPHVGEAVEVQRGDERVAEAADRRAALALDVALDRDAVVAPDGLREDAVVGDRVGGAEERPALGGADRTGDLAGAGAGPGVLRDR